MEWYNGGDIGTEDGARWNTRHVGLVPLWPNGSLFVSYKTDLLVVLAPGAKGRKMELGTKCWQMVEVVLVPILSAMNVLCLHRLWGDSLSEGEAPVCYLSMPLSSSVQRTAQLHILCISVQNAFHCTVMLDDVFWPEYEFVYFVFVISIIFVFLHHSVRGGWSVLYLGLACLSLSSVACEGVETMGGYIGWTNTILVLYAAPRYWKYFM